MRPTKCLFLPLTFVAILAGAPACAAWVRLPATGEIDLPPNKVLQVWSGENVLLVRDFQIDGDSLRGLVRRTGYCDNCMFAIARDQVDSIRAAPEVRIDRGLALGVIVVLAYVWLIHAAGGPGS